MFCCLGPTANIRSINAKDLREYLNNHYKASRIVVAGAGGVNHEELVQLTETHLGKLGINENSNVYILLIHLKIEICIYLNFFLFR